MSRGRKTKYNIEDMMEQLKQVAAEYPEKTITAAFLGKVTDYPRHAWESEGTAYEPVRKAIQRLRQKSVVDVKGKKTYSLSMDLVEKVKDVTGDKKIISMCNEYAQSATAVVVLCRQQEEKIRKLEEELSTLKNELKQCQEQSEHFEDAYCSLFIDSGNSSTATKKGLVSPPKIRENKELSAVLEDSEMLEALTELNSL